MARLLRRYQSEIYGNYRKAYVRYGSLAGVLLSLAVLLQCLIMPDNKPSSPETYLTDGILAIAIFVACYLYRLSLADGRVTLKELMLLGLGMGVVASIVYGLLLWLLCGVCFPDLVAHFIDVRISLMTPASESAEAALAVDATRHYTAGDWAFIGGFRTFVISIIITFLAALIFRTEKAPLR